MHRVLITVNHLEKNVNPESPFKDTPLGNLVTDSYRDVTGTQIGITVQGLMSEAIYQGGISGSDVFRSVGYGFDTDNGLGFRLVTFKLYGAELLGAMEFALASASQSADYYPQVSGMTFKFNSNRPDNKKIVPGSVRIGGNTSEARRKLYINMQRRTVWNSFLNGYYRKRRCCNRHE